MTHDFNPSTQEVCEFKANLVSTELQNSWSYSVRPSSTKQNKQAKQTRNEHVLSMCKSLDSIPEQHNKLPNLLEMLKKSISKVNHGVLGLLKHQTR